MTTEPPLDLPGTGWHLWPWAVLRTAGFPADGLDRLAAPDCAAAADAHLAGLADESAYGKAFEAATQAGAEVLLEIAADPLFREAVTWQSLNALEALDGLARKGPNARRNNRHRTREIVVTRYWQRYCAKNDTIGFFGPVCWARFAADGAAGHARPGPNLVRERVVEFEWRALNTFVARLAADARYHPWLPITLPPHLALDGDLLLRPDAPAQHLSPAVATILRLATTHSFVTPALPGVGSREDRPLERTAQEVALLAVAEGRAGLRKAGDAHLLIDQLVREGLLRRGFELPQAANALARLRSGLEALGEAQLRAEALAALQRLTDARDAVAARAGDPAGLRESLLRMEEEFAAVTGGAVRHRPGATYAGRSVLFEDTARDLDVVLGPRVREGLAPIGPVLQAARWLTTEIAREYLATAHELYDEAAGQIQLGQLSYLANGVMLTQVLPGRVMAEFTKRWWKALGCDDPSVSRVQVSAADLEKAVAELFAAPAPGWGTARLHSPDVHLCAPSAQALQEGDFTAVLGELHVAWLTCDSGVFARFHPDLQTLGAALHRDVGDRVVLRFPPDYPEFTARLGPVLRGPDDFELVYADAPAADPQRLLPLAALSLSLVDGHLAAAAKDGRRWPLTELFSPFLSAMAADAFKLVSAGPHTPRITVDRLVVQRETWRTTVGETGVAEVLGEAERYLAVRRWRASAGLPERVFAKLSTESKPFYVDFTSPASVASFVAMARAAGAAAALVLSEMLPTAQQAWVSDAQGRRYLSELRMTLRDPIPGGQS